MEYILHQRRALESTRCANKDLKNLQTVQMKPNETKKLVDTQTNNGARPQHMEA